MKKYTFLIVVLIFVFGCSSKTECQKPVGPYLGQVPPAGSEDKLFAPGIVSNGMDNRDVTMMPNGKEIYFCASFGNFNYSAIMFCHQNSDGTWTNPEIAPFSRNPEYMDFEPCISPDGKHLYFLSNRPDFDAGDTVKGDQDIWVVDRIGDGWGEPYNLGEPINSTDEEYYPSVTKEGTIYFTRQEKGSPIGFIYRSQLIDGKYQEPEKLPEQVNCGSSQFNAFISPDEDFIIVPVAGMETTLGGVDYYITFRNNADQWSEPQNMGKPVNSENAREWSASLSADGKYLFFMSGRSTEKPKDLTYGEFIKIFDSSDNGSSNVYWISAELIEKLRPEGF
ncbi:MAG: PD40 domain-containing protein [Candidatus Marinimicrobia bacterium]|nr:PD40 domain-containing protein [Candidatus Neomarinimicrobiota bacterium]